MGPRQRGRGRRSRLGNAAMIPAVPVVVCNSPEAEVAEELCEGIRLVVRIQAAGIRQDPGVATAKGGLLKADAGRFDAGADSVGAAADKCDNRGAPAFDFGLKPPAAGAEFVIGEFVGADSCAFDDVGDAETEVEKEGFLKG